MGSAKNQLFLIYGNSETEVQEERFNLVHKLLSAEERDSGLTEIRSAGNMPLTLAKSLSEILGELGMASFIAGSRRVVVIYDLKDFFTAKRGAQAAKSKPKPGGDAAVIESFEQWVRDVLPTTENVAIFVCVENDEKMKTVAADGALFQVVARHGTVLQRREKPLNFELENHLLSGNTTAAIGVLREWIRRAGNDSSGRGRIYSTIANHTELLFQARCVAEAKKHSVPESQVLGEQWPSLRGRGVPEFKAKKLADAARRLTLERAGEIIREVNRLQRLMYPSGNEAYVSSWEDQAELIVLRLTA